jgi:hypothetical protein
MTPIGFLRWPVSAAVATLGLLLAVHCGKSTPDTPVSSGDAGAGAGPNSTDSGATAAADGSRGEDSAVATDASTGDGASNADDASTRDAGSAHLSAGTLVLRIGGAEQGVTYDVVRVADRAILGGQLVLEYTSGYAPPAGQRFVLIEAEGGVTGSFATVNSQGTKVQSGQDATTFWVTATP